MLSIEAFNKSHIALRIGVSLCCATLGGYLASVLGVPLPWLIGALSVSSALALSGMRPGIPTLVRKVGQLLAGLSIGLHFTLEVAGHIASLWIWIIGTGVLSILFSAVLSGLLCRLTGCDRKTAYFASLPGGVAEMAGMAEKFGADVTLVSLCQALRIVVIVVTVPPTIVLLSDALGSAQESSTNMLPLGHLGLGAAIALVVSAALQRFRVLNSWFLGGIIVGSVFGVILPQETVAPSAIPTVAQLLIGASLGARFDLASLRAVGWKVLPATIAMTSLLIGFNAGLAGLMTDRLDLLIGILATAPGGIAEMSLTAEQLHLSPPLITAWHLVRVLLIAFLSAPLFHLGRRLGGRID